MEEQDLGISLIQTLRKSALAELAPDFAEVALDSLIEQGPVKELPFVRSLLAFYKTQVTIRDLLLLRKIISFIREVKKDPDADKEEFLERITSDKKQQRKVGENLILYLDRLDDLEKPVILAKLFVGFLKRSIDLETFQRLAIATDRAFIGDLKRLKSYYSDLKKVPRNTLHHLAQAGLVRFESHMILEADGILFEPSELGKLFIELVFRE